MGSSKKIPIEKNFADLTKKLTEKRRAKDTNKSFENVTSFTKISQGSSDFKSFGISSSSKIDSNERKRQNLLQADNVDKNKSLISDRKKQSDPNSEKDPQDEYESLPSSKSRGKQTVHNSVIQNRYIRGSESDEFHSASGSFKSIESPKSTNSDDKKCTKRRVSNPIRERFRNYFRRLSPMYAKNIKTLTVKEESVLQWAGWLDYRLFVCSWVVGLGNLGYFPLRFLNYGAFHFFSIYVIVIVVVGYPMVLMEAGLGQFCSQGPGGCWEFGKLFKGLGYVFILWAGLNNITILHEALTDLILMYDSFYTYAWTKPSNSTVYNNTELDKNVNNTIENSLNVEILPEDPMFQEKLQDPAMKRIIFYTFNWLIVVVLLIPNIRSRGFIITRLFLLLAVLFSLICMRGLFLPGALAGIEYGLSYQSGLTVMDYEVWLRAFEQCFFTMGSFPGLHMTLSKYNHFNNQICFDVLFCLLVDFFFSLVGFILMFSYLGSLAQTTTFVLQDTPKVKGAEVLLVKLPYVMSGLEFGFVWVLLFYLTIFLVLHLNLSSLFEVIVTGVVDTFKINLRNNKRKYVVLGICAVDFILLLADEYLMKFKGDLETLIEFYTGTYLSVGLSLCFLCSVLYVIGVDQFLSMLECCVGWDATPMLSSPWWKRYWKICWTSIPLIYVVVLITHVYHEQTAEREPFKPWMIIVGRLLWVCFALIILGTMAYLIVTTKQGGFWSRIRFLTTPTPEWGPVLPQNRYIMEIGEQDRLKKITCNKVKKKSTIKYFHQLRMSL